MHDYARITETSEILRIITGNVTTMANQRNSALTWLRFCTLLLLRCTWSGKNCAIVRTSTATPRDRRSDFAPPHTHTHTLTRARSYGSAFDITIRRENFARDSRENLSRDPLKRSKTASRGPIAAVVSTDSDSMQPAILEVSRSRDLGRIGAII